MNVCPRCFKEVPQFTAVQDTCSFCGQDLSYLFKLGSGSTPLGQFPVFVGVDEGQGPNYTFISVWKDGNLVLQYDTLAIDQFMQAVRDKDVVAAINAMGRMNDAQLRDALMQCYQEAVSAHRSSEFLMTKKGQETVEKIRELKDDAKKAGFEIWPELS